MAPKLNASDLARISELEQEDLDLSSRYRHCQSSSSVGVDLFTHEDPGEDVNVADQSEDDLSPHENIEENDHDNLLTVLGELWGLGQLSATNAQRSSRSAAITAFTYRADRQGRRVRDKSQKCSKRFSASRRG